MPLKSCRNSEIQPVAIFAFTGSKPTTAGKVGCEMGGWEGIPSLPGCAGGTKTCVSWFVGVEQMWERCRLLKIGSGIVVWYQEGQ